MEVPHHLRQSGQTILQSDASDQFKFFKLEKIAVLKHLMTVHKNPKTSKPVVTYLNHLFASEMFLSKNLKIRSSIQDHVTNLLESKASARRHTFVDVMILVCKEEHVTSRFLQSNFTQQTLSLFDAESSKKVSSLHTKMARDLFPILYKYIYQNHYLVEKLNQLMGYMQNKCEMASSKNLNGSIVEEMAHEIKNYRRLLQSNDFVKGVKAFL